MYKYAVLTHSSVSAVYLNNFRKQIIDFINKLWPVNSNCCVLWREFLNNFNVFFSYLDNKESSLIVIILDSNPSQRIIRQNPQHLTQCLDSICVLGNSHLMQRAQNSLAVLACHHNGT